LFLGAEMILKKARVTNFRSVEDSGEFDIDSVTCLVGKNEAGKTAILTAIAGFEPHKSSPISFDVERDYPRRHLNDYRERHPDEDATVVSLIWELEDDDVAAIEDHLGEGCLSSRTVEGVRRYKADEPEWSANINYRKVIDRFISEAALSASEMAQIGKPANSQELKATIDKIETPTDKQKALRKRIEDLPGGYILGAVREVLSSRSPYMMYFSHYDRMVGQVRLDTLKARLKGSAAPPVEPGERVFLDFLHFAGTSLDEINSAKTYETLNARCESASIKITDQLQEYWTQNPNLSIEVRVTKGEPGDDPPYNDGIVSRARVRNDLHRMTVPFSERSAGFIWFFSFLVKFAEVKKSGEPVLLLLDEPGLTLHGTAQADLLRYFDDKLEPFHQVVFSTHSPFMVPATNLSSVRVVEDRLIQKRPGVWDSEGTRVRQDTLSVDRDTLFPLQGALGYELTQTLFVGVNTLLVEGPSDILYLQAISEELGNRRRTRLDPRWVLCPAGGIDKIQTFVGLFHGNKLNIAALTDFSKSDRQKISNLEKSGILETGHLMTYASLLESEEADVEDIFGPDLYAEILNGAYGISKRSALSGQKLREANSKTSRTVKLAEEAMKLVKGDIAEFDHFHPSSWLIRNPGFLEQEGAAEALDRGEKVIKALNALLD